jgi:hypothetical protein
VTQVNTRDLMIIARSRVAMSDLIDRFPDLTTRYEVRFEQRWHERRSADLASDENRRRRDRRRLDVSEMLRRDGWAIVPGARRNL